MASAQSAYFMGNAVKIVACVASVSPPTPPSFMFFLCSCPSFLDELREETLATQAIKIGEHRIEIKLAERHAH